MFKDLDLSFKGDRNYLHGTDIFDTLLAWLREQGFEIIEGLDLSFHQMATSTLRAELDLVDARDVKNAAILSFASQGSRHRVSLRETAKAVTGRRPYPEDRLVADAEFDATTQAIRVENCLPGYSAIEYWIALTKAMHLRALPHVSGKWLFVRARFPRLDAPLECVRPAVQLTSNYQDKLTRSEVSLDGRKFGDIYFSLLQEGSERP
ncbi:hypothetical protein ACH58_23340 [Achromobacter xylosoxidans]|uniref:hypothetical protein n=1 Tax=Alcaligenes xylosoxydans xylosoxydans TaxID=85698 RepID=UPI00064DE992|nr:hypothetical protein [Achromobacter xylosoxidans]KMJ88302.1 hypothetical protein ACH58_23340 [Achromobacter xylosoxidans]